MAHLYRAAAHRIQYLERRHQFAAGKYLDLQTAVTRLLDSPCKILDTDA
jgi:hypothetical protein